LRNEIAAACAPVRADPSKLRRILLTLFDRVLTLVDGDIGVVAKVGVDGVQLDFCDLSQRPGAGATSFARAGLPRDAAPPPDLGLDAQAGGLTACRRLARMMGGHVAVNRQAIGCWVFSLTLPRARGAASVVRRAP
ncbi:MAG: hypothetical protein KGO01_21700, partial [Burkholderiales bacterium]|nr:hypothetical protein [Burkholderiales bacterium]